MEYVPFQSRSRNVRISPPLVVTILTGCLSTPTSLKLYGTATDNLYVNSSQLSCLGLPRSDHKDRPIVFAKPICCFFFFRRSTFTRNHPHTLDINSAVDSTCHKFRLVFTCTVTIVETMTDWNSWSGLRKFNIQCGCVVNTRYPNWKYLPV